MNSQKIKINVTIACEEGNELKIDLPNKREIKNVPGLSDTEKIRNKVNKERLDEANEAVLEALIDYLTAIMKEVPLEEQAILFTNLKTKQKHLNSLNENIPY